MAPVALSSALDQKPTARRAQTTFWCRACGGEGKRIGGLCSRCYARRHWDKHYFAGLRAHVLERDGHACQLCTQPAQGKRSIVVHHRRPGISKAAYLISLCPACHARLHKTQVLRHGVVLGDPGAHLPAAALWRELHPDGPEQLALEFDRGRVPGHAPAQTPALSLGVLSLGAKSLDITCLGETRSGELCLG